MSDLSKLVLPVKDPSTGEVTNQEFNLTGGGGAEYYLVQDAIISSTNDTTVTFADPKITADSTIYVDTNIVDLMYKSISIDTGICTIIFPKQESAKNASIKIYIK